MKMICVDDKPTDVSNCKEVVLVLTQIDDNLIGHGKYMSLKK